MAKFPRYRVIDRRFNCPPGQECASYIVAVEDCDASAPKEVFSSDNLEEARARAAELNRQSFEMHIRGKKFDRYITTWHVVITVEEARHRCKTDYMNWDEVEITPQLELIHTDAEFALWSDDRITRPVEGMPPGGSLSPDAVSLLRLFCEADWGTVEGGPILLARVARIIRREDIRTAPLSSERVEKLEILWTNNQSGVLYSRLIPHFEGYQYYIYQNLKS